MYCPGKQCEINKVGAFLRRICDLTSPNFPRIDDERCDCRQNRTIPVLLTPWENDRAVVSDSVTALSKDISNRGLSVTLPGPFRADEVVVGIWLPDTPESEGPRFFLGAARQNVPIGGGFWALGIEVIRMLANNDVEAIVPVAQKRLRHQPVEMLAMLASADNAI